jgi:hypothetical protein
MTVGPDQGMPDFPDRYEAPNGVEVIDGVADDAGSRDPSATSVAGAVSNAYAQMVELESDVNTDHIGDLIDLPPLNYQ